MYEVFCDVVIVSLLWDVCGTCVVGERVTQYVHGVTVTLKLHALVTVTAHPKVL